MEQGKTNQNDSQLKNTPDNLMEYRIYEHPLLPKRIVKIGYCWPALIIGPAYLIYRRLWVPLIIWIMAIVVIRVLALYNVPECENCPISLDEMNTIEQISGGAIFVGLILLGLLTNGLWEKNLITRGYILIKSLNARSMDDALAIIERGKNSVSITQDHNSNLIGSANRQAETKSENTISNYIKRPIDLLDKIVFILLTLSLVSVILYNIISK